MPYVEVAVDAPSGRPTYSYRAPDGMDIRPGALVWVPFGSRVVRGVIVATTLETEYDSTKDVLAGSSSCPLSPLQLRLASFISSKYSSSLFSALALFLPPGIERQVSVYYEVSPLAGESDAQLTTEESDVLRRAQRRGRLAVADTGSGARRTVTVRAIESLLGRGFLVKREEPRERRVKVRLETVVSLTDSTYGTDVTVESPDRARAPRQQQVLACLVARGGTATAANLRAEAGASLTTLKAMQSRGLVRLEDRRVWRSTMAGLPPSELPSLSLSDAQVAALRPVLDSLDGREFSEYLLFGVTGSGKTELYLQASARVLSLGRQVVCLVPEIALAAQTVERFVARFPGRVALLHSGLTLGQQADEWERLQQGQADIVVGPRSALFAPLERVGLIIIDEEHEWTYKQEDVAPRYHARDVARELARQAGAVLMLGSATPDVETFHRAEAGATRMLELPARVAGGARLPPIEVVDMRAELRAGNAALFSRSLLSAMADTLSRREQVLLFLNRRGTATLVQCRHCGYVFSCPRCAVALAYHEARHALLCHRCGYATQVPARCPTCGSPRLRYLGAGTQRVVQETLESFPDARVVRWDSDVPARVRGGSALQDAVRGGHVDVVVGTQMVAKGHDFANVTLVGVISADVGLGVPDYRSAERVFQLVSQASGRAGRGVNPGQVVVQTYEPESHVVRSAATHDYRAFYGEEIRYRHEVGYPPFASMVKLLFAHPNENRCRLEAQRVHALLVRAAPTGYRMTGPAPAFVARLRGRYRWQLTLRGEAPTEVLREVVLPRGWTVDVDPASIA
jgi:primosomal protein N' (replication factor Y) (superfamily II helicase)